MECWSITSSRMPCMSMNYRAKRKKCMNAEAQRTQRRKSRVHLSSLRPLRLCGICVLFIAAWRSRPKSVTKSRTGRDVARPASAHWASLVLGIPGQFTIDDSVRHEGRRSIRIDAPESTRLYLRSDPIAVAPGEKITASAWVKCKDVPPGKGNIILIGEFTNSTDAAPSVERFGQLEPQERHEHRLGPRCAERSLSRL